MHAYRCLDTRYFYPVALRLFILPFFPVHRASASSLFSSPRNSRPLSSSCPSSHLRSGVVVKTDKQTAAAALSCTQPHGSRRETTGERSMPPPEPASERSCSRRRGRGRRRGCLTFLSLRLLPSISSPSYSSVTGPPREVVPRAFHLHRGGSRRGHPRCGRLAPAAAARQRRHGGQPWYTAPLPERWCYRLSLHSAGHLRGATTRPPPAWQPGHWRPWPSCAVMGTNPDISASLPTRCCCRSSLHLAGHLHGRPSASSDPA